MEIRHGTTPLVSFIIPGIVSVNAQGMQHTSSSRLLSTLTARASESVLLMSADPAPARKIWPVPTRLSASTIWVDVDFVNNPRAAARSARGGELGLSPAGDKLSDAPVQSPCRVWVVLESSGNFAGFWTHRTKVQYTAFGSAGKSALS